MVEDWFNHFMISLVANIAFGIIFYVWFKKQRRKRRK